MTKEYDPVEAPDATGTGSSMKITGAKVIVCSPSRHFVPGRDQRNIEDIFW
jgi:hypothetical protein